MINDQPAKREIMSDATAPTVTPITPPMIERNSQRPGDCPTYGTDIAPRRIVRHADKERHLGVSATWHRLRGLGHGGSITRRGLAATRITAVGPASLHPPCGVGPWPSGSACPGRREIYLPGAGKSASLTACHRAGAQLCPSSGRSGRGTPLRAVCRHAPVFSARR